MKIRIKNDPCNMWHKDQIIDARELIDTYIGGLNAEEDNDRDCIAMMNDPEYEEDAVQYAAEIWEIEWEKAE